MTHPSQPDPSDYHGAGVVIVGKWLGLFIVDRPTGDAEERKFLENYITASWAGIMAVRRADVDPQNSTQSFDDQTGRLGETMVTAGIAADTDEIEAIIAPLRTQAATLVEAHWDEIDALAHSATPQPTDGKVIPLTRGDRSHRR